MVNQMLALIDKKSAWGGDDKGHKHDKPDSETYCHPSFALYKVRLELADDVFCQENRHHRQSHYHQYGIGSVRAAEKLDATSDDETHHGTWHKAQEAVIECRVRLVFLGLRAAQPDRGG
jgi:hypothetical protein